MFRVVIPSFARPERLAQCLDALARTEFAGAFEVVVVDDGSPQPLAPVIDGFADRLPVRSQRQDNRGPAAARNAGARTARGRILAFTDDDCLPDRHWIAAMARAGAAQPLALIGGRVDNALPANIYSAASQDLVDYLYEYFGAAAGDAPFFTSNNIACDRARFLDLGGFDESFPLAAGEDRELGMRWRDRAVRSFTRRTRSWAMRTPCRFSVIGGSMRTMVAARGICTASAPIRGRADRDSSASPSMAPDRLPAEARRTARVVAVSAHGHVAACHDLGLPEPGGKRGPKVGRACRIRGMAHRRR